MTKRQPINTTEQQHKVIEVLAELISKREHDKFVPLTDAVMFAVDEYLKNHFNYVKPKEN